MTPQAELRIIRAAYAKQILSAANTRDVRLAAAFAAIPREDFVGPGPWLMLRWWRRDYVPTPDADPVYLYTNDLVALLPERRLNNGQPSLHAHLMHQASPVAGEHVVHVGTGTGYYTAILAHLVGPSGRVTGIEFDPDLAARARANLAPYANVRIREGDGTCVSFEPADVIYVNAGCTRPAMSWLDNLADGGRLILPLTSDAGFKSGAPEQVARAGAVFRVRRKAADYDVAWISPVAIIPCDGGRDEVSEKALAQAFARGNWEKVTRLYREDIPEERCWLRGDGWCLAYN
jgi:protein-L-isoaspartate(D-aspartate) O-methyltransferase